MKQKLINIGQKITELINIKLQDQQISQDEYLELLQKLEIIIDIEQKKTSNEIIEIK